MKATVPFIVFGILGLILISCNNKRPPNDRLLAEVNNHKVYFSDFVSEVGNIEPSDTNNQIKRFIDHWIRKQIIFDEVQKSVVLDKEFENLVEDYRSSLKQEQFEKTLIEQELDTFIPTSEVQNYFSSNESYFLLKGPVFKITWVKLKADIPQIDNFFTWWKENDIEKVEQFCSKNAESFSLNHLDWSNLGDIFSVIPHDLFDDNSLKVGKTLQDHHEGYEYFLKIHDRKDKSEKSPLEYVEDEIRMVLIQKRKVEVIRQWKEKLFEEKFISKNVKIYQ